MGTLRAEISEILSDSSEVCVTLNPEASCGQAPGCTYVVAFTGRHRHTRAVKYVEALDGLTGVEAVRALGAAHVEYRPARGPGIILAADLLEPAAG